METYQTIKYSFGQKQRLRDIKGPYYYTHKQSTTTEEKNLLT